MTVRASQNQLKRALSLNQNTGLKNKNNMAEFLKKSIGFSLVLGSIVILAISVIEIVKDLMHGDMTKVPIMLPVGIYSYLLLRSQILIMTKEIHQASNAFSVIIGISSLIVCILSFMGVIHSVYLEPDPELAKISIASSVYHVIFFWFLIKNTE